MRINRTINIFIYFLHPKCRIILFLIHTLFYRKICGLKIVIIFDKTEIDDQTYMKKLSANTLITQTNISGFKRE